MRPLEKKAFSLVELIVASMIAVILSLSVFAAYHYHAKQDMLFYHSLQARNYARDIMEDLLRRDYNDPEIANNAPIPDPVNLPDSDFRNISDGGVTKMITPVLDGGGTQVGKDIEIVVTWDEGGTKHYTQELRTTYAQP
ncbi:prepilin-type N-terminal cleavage/methylation domain-containing protein [Candidatus Omnitrophota bacterium]